MKELVGKTIKRIHLDDEGDWIVFDCVEGLVAYRAEGDCCSKSWVEEVSGVYALLDAKVNEVRENDLNDKTVLDHPEHDCLRFYSYTIMTTKGYADVAFRNASNGYYGGSLEHRSMEALPGNLQVVTEDWTAGVTA